MAKAWHDPRVPADVDCVLRPLLERRAAETPDKVFALFADGSAWTYREAREAARRAAVGFRRLGVAQGDTSCPGCPTARMRSASGSGSTISARSTCRSISPTAAGFSSTWSTIPTRG